MGACVRAWRAGHLIQGGLVLLELLGEQRLAVAFVLQRAPDGNGLGDALLSLAVVLHILVHGRLRLDGPRHLGVGRVEALDVALLGVLEVDERLVILLHLEVQVAEGRVRLGEELLLLLHLLDGGRTDVLARVERLDVPLFGLGEFLLLLRQRAERVVRVSHLGKVFQRLAQLQCLLKVLVDLLVFVPVVPVEDEAR